MNSFFNPKRFFLLERYKMPETSKHLLWSTIIVVSICALTMLFDINRGENFTSQHSSGANISRYTLWFLLIAPCLLEANLTKRNSILYILLPGSMFEKFLHIWVKYTILLPAFCALIIVCLKGLLSMTDITYLHHFATDISNYCISKDQAVAYSILQSAFFTGYFRFKKQSLLKSFTACVLIIVICFGIIVIIMSALPDDTQGYQFNNIVTWPETNIPLSPAGGAIILFCNYAAPICLVLGSWISSYFLLKEKQL